MRERETNNGVGPCLMGLPVSGGVPTFSFLGLGSWLIFQYEKKISRCWWTGKCHIPFLLIFFVPSFLHNGFFPSSSKDGV